MKTLSNEDVNKVNQMVMTFDETKNENATLEQNMVDFYLSQLPGTSTEEADEIVGKIKCGVSTFNQTLNEALSENGIDYVEKLKAMGEGKTNEEQYELYVNFLSALTALDISNFEGENFATIESFDEIKGQIFTVTGEVSDEELEEIIGKVAEALKNTTFAMSSAEMINELIEKLPDEGVAGAKEIISGSEEDVRIKMVTSLATLIAHQKGELESTAGSELTAEQITVEVCTGIEESKIFMNVKKGLLTVENAILLLKILGGVALSLILGYLFALAAANVTGILVGLIIGLFGSSTAVLVIASIIGIGFAAASLYGICTDLMPKIMGWAENSFDKAVKAWRETAWPYITEKANKFVEWIKGLKENGVLADSPVVVPDSDVVVQQTTV